MGQQPTPAAFFLHVSPIFDYELYIINYSYQKSLLYDTVWFNFMF